MGVSLCIDYLTFSIKTTDEDLYPLSLNWLYQFLGISQDDFFDIGGRMHYEHCYVGSDGISVYEPYPSRRLEMGLCVSMTGSGCRYFEGTMKDGDSASGVSLWSSFFRRLRELTKKGYKVNVSRIDIAADDKSDDGQKLLDLDKIEQCTNSREFVSQFRHMYDYTFKNIMTGQGTGKCLYFGTLRSEVMCRFYDKLMEQRSKHANNKELLRTLEPIKHWARMEFVFKRKRAMAVIHEICDSECFAAYFAKVVNGYVRFVNNDDVNTSRRSMKSWWYRFIGTLETARLSVEHDAPRTFERVKSYYQKFLSTTVFSLISKISPAEFFNMTYEAAAARIRSKHLRVMGLPDAQTACSIVQDVWWCAQGV